MRLVNLIPVFLFTSGAALAQAGAQSAQPENVAQRITQLTQDVATLKAQRAPGATAGPAPGAPLEVKSASGATQVDILSNNDGGLVHLYNSRGRGVILLGVVEGPEVGAIEILHPYDPRTQLVSITTDSTGSSGWINVDGPSARFNVRGQAHDYAEVFDLVDRGGIQPGSVVAQASSGRGLVLASGAYNPAVVGVIAGAGDFHSGMVIGSRDDDSTDLPVAIGGQVCVRVSTEAGAISVGDLLVSSGTPGVAMRGADAARLTGTVVGKALQPYSDQGEGLIKMLVLNR